METIVKPMWVVFWSKTILNKQGKEIISRDGGYKLLEFSEIKHSEEKARDRYAEIIKEDLVYCAGYASIKQGTEPHWIDGGS